MNIKKIFMLSLFMVSCSYACEISAAGPFEKLIIGIYRQEEQACEHKQVETGDDGVPPVVFNCLSDNPETALDNIPVKPKKRHVPRGLSGKKIYELLATRERHHWRDQALLEREALKLNVKPTVLHGALLYVKTRELRLSRSELISTRQIKSFNKQHQVDTIVRHNRNILRKHFGLTSDTLGDRAQQLNVDVQKLKKYHHHLVYSGQRLTKDFVFNADEINAFTSGIYE